MAYESYYWRELIKQDVLLIEGMLKLSHKAVDDEKLDEQFSILEIKLMTLAYVARKLADSHKLPDKTLRMKVKVLVYPRTSESRRIFGNIEKEYNLETNNEAELAFRNICNQIIHSYILQAVGSERRVFRHLWFVSDQNRDKGLYQIDLKDFTKAMLMIANSYVTKMNSHYDQDREEWVVEKF